METKPPAKIVIESREKGTLWLMRINRQIFEPVEVRL